MKSIICVLSLLMAVQQAEAHSYRDYHHKKKEHKSYHHSHHQHGRSCGHNTTPPTTPVCSNEQRVVNGNFESNPVTNSSQWQLLTSLTGWKIESTNKQGCCSSTPWAELQAFPGEQLQGSTQYIELDTHPQNTNSCSSSSTNIQISQNIEAKVGETLKLEFNYKPRSLSYGKMELLVSFGANNLVFNNFSNTNWQTFSKEYKVNYWDLKNGKMPLIIKENGLANTYGMFVDNVSVKMANCTAVVTPDFDAQFYYIDNAAQKIYKGAVNGQDVVLKEFLASPYSSAHIAQSDFETLVVVESAGNKRVKTIDIDTKVQADAGRFNFLGTLAQVYASEDYIIANQEGTNKIYNQDLINNTTTVLGQVLYNQQPLILNGGDLYQGLTGILYAVTNQGGGSLYSLELDPIDNTKINATLIVSGLGTVTGLVQLSTGEMLVSLQNSTTMKIVDVYLQTVRSVTLKGDLIKQGSQGGDLAGFDTL